MWRAFLFIPALILSGSFGCVSVHTPDTHVEVGPTNFFSGSDGETTDATPYAKTANRVMRQQSKVAKELAGGDWAEIIDEADQWREHSRNLGSYANQSYDPPAFRRASDDIVAKVDSVYRSAISHDMSGCQRGMDASNVAIYRFMDMFPLTHSEANAAAAAKRSHQKPAPSSSRQQRMP